MACALNPKDKTSFVQGYLFALHLVKALHQEKKLSWERAVAVAGQRLYELLGEVGEAPAEG